MLERGTSSDRIDVTALPSPRLLHTHLTYDVIPKGKTDDTKCKYIYVMRNPKDVAVSFYEFLKPKDSTTVSGFNGPWEFFARLLLEGKGESNNDANLSFPILHSVSLEFSGLKRFFTHLPFNDASMILQLKLPTMPKTFFSNMFMIVAS